MTKKKIGLIGFAYDAPSLNLLQENRGIAPYYFEWAQGDYDQEIVVYCEQTMFEPKKDHAKFRVGLLLEPQELRPWHYQKAFEQKNEFDMILTHSKLLLSYGMPFAFYPLGGSYLNLANWGMHPKSKGISIIPGYKTEMSGHALRHFIVERFGSMMDVFPWGSLQDSKSKALKPYHYSIIIENTQADYWFTEKIIDAFSQGTIPIYWGCPSIKNFFDTRGIISFDTVAELETIIKFINKEGTKYYEDRLASIEFNLNEAKKYSCVENWLSKQYPDIFK